MTDPPDQMRRYGLARCFRCRRIVLATHLQRGRCRDLADCHEAFWRAEEPVTAPAEEEEGDDGTGA